MAVKGLEALLPASLQGSDLLRQALTHRSAGQCHNERLEYLGDSALNFIVAAHLFALRPQAPEGELSRLRASLVNQDSLAQIARDQGMGTLLSLGDGERKSGGHRRDSILADALEAVIGAVYLATDFDTTRDFVLRLYGRRFAALPSAEDLKDPKTRLQEWLQRKNLDIPSYQVLEVTGKPHDQHFKAACHIKSRNISVIGEGSSRRRAEQAAAVKAFAALTHTEEQQFG